jgi:hypothetical protein
VTITAVESLDRPARLLHPIGIRLTRFKQPACAADTLGCQFPLSLRRPFGPTAPKPLVVPRGFQAGVQLNFEVGGCTRAAPGLRETVNRAVLVRYTVGGQRQETRINLHGIQLHIAAPPLGACLRLP